MDYRERLERIVQVLKAQKHVKVADLSRELGTSDVTVRKDLTILEDRGVVVRTHGGASLAEKHETPVVPLVAPMERNAYARVIAREAGQFLADGMNVAIDAGAMSLELAREVARFNLVVVTNSIPAASYLASYEGVSLYVTAGSLYRRSMGLIGPKAVGCLADMNMDLCFLNTVGFSVDTGFSGTNLIEMQVKRSMLQRSMRSVILAEGTSWGMAGFCTFAQLEECNVLITDERLPGNARAALAEVETEVIYASLPGESANQASG